VLLDFIRNHELDLVFLQEVTDPTTLNVAGYITHHNIGSNTRGMAILTKQDLFLVNVQTLPSGRAMATDHNGVRLVNVYAPSGTAKRAAKEFFFHSELPELLSAPSHSMIIKPFKKSWPGATRIPTRQQKCE
jgi:exonuclease III